MSDDNSRSGGIGFGGLLTIVFIILKLTKTIDWRWIWVLSPAWIGIAVVVALVVLLVFVDKRY